MLIANRSGMVAGGVKIPYVADGLVAWWDGIWNAGLGKHDANATVWKDLCGGTNQDFALTEHGSWGDNYFLCDGLAVAAVCGKVFPYADIRTIECVVRMTTATAGAVIFNLSPGYYTGGYYYMTRDLMWSTNPTGDGYTMSGTPEINNVSRVCYVGQVGSDLAFSGRYANGGPVCTAMTVDGTNQTSTQLRHGAAANTTAAVLGGRSPSTTFLSAGRIYTLRLYSRALTDAEIEANCAVDKRRFNLP